MNYIYWCYIGNWWISETAPPTILSTGGKSPISEKSKNILLTYLHCNVPLLSSHCEGGGVKNIIWFNGKLKKSAKGSQSVFMEIRFLFIFFVFHLYSFYCYSNQEHWTSKDDDKNVILYPNILKNKMYWIWPNDFWYF